MEISRRTLGAVLVLALDGRLDAATAPLLQQALGQAWDEGSRNIVLDCARLRYVSSAGLQVFLVAGQLARKQGGRLAFSNLGPALGEIFQMTKFDALFSLYTSTEEAAASF